MSLLRRGAASLALTALVATGLASGAYADNIVVDGDYVDAAGVVSLGTLCRDKGSSTTVSFDLVRNGQGQVWGNRAVVTVTPGTPSTSSGGALTLGSASATMPADWTTLVNNRVVGTGPASVSLNVPAGAVVGDASSTVTYTASGAGDGRDTVSRTTDVTFNWTVEDCQPTDSTAPAVNHVLDPPAPDGENGWYRSDVTIDWTVTDAESAARLEGCEDETFGTDGTHASSCTAISKGGTTGPVEVEVKRDATPPTVEPTVTGNLGEDGWYVGDVDVTWAVEDATSGIATTSPDCAGSILIEDSTEQTYTCTVTDEAGNQTEVSVEVKRDATDPVITSTVDGALGNNGWYTGDVDISWDVTDATSKVAMTSGCEPVTVDADTSGTTYTCLATDNAGNDVSNSVTVKRDATAPSITFTRSGTEGDNDWFTGPATVNWTVTDSGSGVASQVGCDQKVVNDDGVHQVTCTATDAAGNSDSVTAVVHKDATAPAVVPAVTGDLGDNGWYVSDVLVAWETSDETSGLAAGVGCAPVTVDVDTTGQRLECSVTDVAGNTGSGEVTVKRDATAPDVSFTAGPEDGSSYYYGDPIPGAACEATDATSGVTDAGCTVSEGGSDVGDGHTITASATDNAGNTGTATRMYNVLAWRLDGFYKPVNTGEGVVNTVKAGSTVPLKFNVFKGETKMTEDIGAAFTVTRIGCEAGEVVAPLSEEFLTTGGTSLRYDASGGQWVQNWATPAKGKGLCYQVTLATADGSSTTADFRLK